MANRQGLIEDLMEFGLRVQPRVGIALAALSWMIFHVVASQSDALSGDSTAVDIAGAAQRSVIHIVAMFLQYAVPFCLLIGVLASVIRHRRSMRIHRNSLDDPRAAIASMSWREFEQLVGESFRQHDFEVVELGGNGPDGGVDLVLHKGGKRYLAQCKHWKAWEVGVGVVRELNGVVAAQRAHGGYVITGGRFSRDAITFADSCGIILIDGPKLVKLLKPSPAEALKNVASCPECGSPMAQKVAGQGQFKGQPFWSCTQFPKCRGKIHIDQVA
jgi:restriction system protein